MISNVKIRLLSSDSLDLSQKEEIVWRGMVKDEAVQARVPALGSD